LLERNGNKIWTSGIALVGCVPGFLNSREIVYWCVDKCDQNQRIIQLQGESLVSLSLSIFKKMLKIPKPTIMFKGDKARSFLKERNSVL